MTTEDLRYPIGGFSFDPARWTAADRQEGISTIATTPEKLRAAVRNLTPEQFDTPYRPGGWSVRQIVHHVPDSHMNSYVRFRLALTEDEPTIMPYAEGRWAELPDARTADPEISLALLDSLHHRWVILLEALKDTDFQRAFRHPEIGPVSLDKAVALYTWHGRHHVAHITGLRKRMGWT